MKTELLTPRQLERICELCDGSFEAGLQAAAKIGYDKAKRDARDKKAQALKSQKRARDLRGKVGLN